jgi:uncharacterized membrane protein YdjX (TVP38/TMEM64 family)
MVAFPLHRRAVVLTLVMLLAVLLMLAQPVHAWLLSWFDAADVVVRQQPIWGPVVFVLLAALSAMLAFVSSVVLVPAAIRIWGPELCFLLLWTGWFLGALAAYAVGRYAGRPLVERLVRPGALRRYEAWTRSGLSLVPILILQLAVPSDLAGYVFGLVRCRLSIFIPAVALAEIPYALGSVYLGTSFLQRRIAPLLLLGAAAVLVSWWAIHRLQSEHALVSTGGLR